ncbi:MAG: hypothetical protein R2710_15590 [Acidimicrobiales bacterium]
MPGYVLSDLLLGGVFTRSGLIVMTAICAAAAVGFADDWIKVRSERNLGLNKRTKSLGLLAVAIGFAVSTHWLTSASTDLSFTRANQLGIDLGPGAG